MLYTSTSINQAAVIHANLLTAVYRTTADMPMQDKMTDQIVELSCNYALNEGV